MAKKENNPKISIRFSAIIDYFLKNEKFILTAHETPDGDAVGSEVALCNVLRRLGKTARIVNADPEGLRYAFLNPGGQVELLDNFDIPREDLADWCLIILDTNDISNIGMVAREILPYVKDYFIIDHHEGGRNIQSRNHVESDASSTCEVLYQLFEEMKVPLDFETAQALYVGIVYDTGCFIYPKTSATTFRIAAELVKAGVSPNLVYSNVYESDSIESLTLYSKVAPTLELYFDRQVAVLTMTKRMLKASGARYDEADTLINGPLKSHTIRVSVFFKENPEGVLRCSLRSKGNIDVASIAQYYGGGGHLTAAGFKSKYPLEEIKKKVLKKLEIYFQSKGPKAAKPKG